MSIAECNWTEKLKKTFFVFEVRVLDGRLSAIFRQCMEETSETKTITILERDECRKSFENCKGKKKRIEVIFLKGWKWLNSAQHRNKGRDQIKWNWIWQNEQERWEQKWTMTITRKLCEE